MIAPLSSFARFIILPMTSRVFSESSHLTQDLIQLVLKENHGDCNSSIAVRACTYTVQVVVYVNYISKDSNVFKSLKTETIGLIQINTEMQLNIGTAGHKAIFIIIGF